MDSASNASAQSSGNPTKHETTVLVLQGGEQIPGQFPDLREEGLLLGSGHGWFSRQDGSCPFRITESAQEEEAQAAALF